MPTRESLTFAFCQQVPAQLLRRIAAALEHCPTGDEPFTTLGLAPRVLHDLQGLMRSYPSPQELAAVLQYGALAQERVAERELSFVWTGPSCYPEVRKTSQVLLDIIRGAQDRLLLASFAAYRVESLLSALQDAVKRGVKVRFVLENDEDSAGQLSYSADGAFRGLQGVAFYHWPREKRPINKAGRPGKMHVKCAVSEQSLFISSANLTADAIENNMELGLLCYDVQQCAKLLQQFEAMFGSGVLCEYCRNIT